MGLPSLIQLLPHLAQSWRREWSISAVSIGFIAIATVGWRVPIAVAQLKLAQSPSLTQDESEVIWLFVNPSTGDDKTGNGQERSPFKTIAQALQAAQPNSAIALAPGVYSSATGESFPLIMKPGVTIRGNPRTRGENITIQGGGIFNSPTAKSQNITILAANGASLIGVTVTNPDPQGYGLWIESSSPIVVDNTFTGNGSGGIAVQGNSAPTIRSNYFYNNGGNGIVVEGILQADVRENVFETRALGVAMVENAAPETKQPEIPLQIVPQDGTTNNLSLSIVEPRPTEAVSVPAPSPGVVPERTVDSGNNNSNTVENRAITSTQGETVPSSSPITADSFPVPSSLHSQNSTAPTQTSGNEPEGNSAQLSVLGEFRQMGGIEITVPSPDSKVDSNPPPTEEPILNSSSQGAEVEPTNRVGNAASLLEGDNSLANNGERPTTASESQYYRVLVEVESETQQDMVRSLVPGAFRTSFNGQTMMQVGSFSSRDRADALRELIESKGWSARVEN
ncbi:MAG TPA: hypothetical protein DDZ80_09090 [Cyanobacteria bacterium UBA8803]|nr:hypothetical protein [Cyanobacteria bacterium UBA9273]HBL58652.1 hypothetical protein [Cyanobacteria bacterium UBA8803]